MSLPSKIGRYDVVAALAAGGMAEILLGRLVGPSGFESTVVIKRILPHLARIDSFVAMFLDEARVAARIRHPNVVFVQELGSEGGDLYLVMEYLAGETAFALSRALVTRPEATPHLAAFIVAEACAGLHAAHELTGPQGERLNLVHRDVSPQNVFITYEGQVKILDFGIAKVADQIAKTDAGVLKGKFDYMAPEHCRGQPLDRRADIFGLGVVLYELTTRRRLFKRGSQLATLKAITEEPIVPPSRLIASYPRALETVVMRALSRNPTDRYPTALEMRRDLLSTMRALDDSSAEPAEALGALLQDLFRDRVEAKREMLRKVSSGSAVTTVPTDDDLVDPSPVGTEGAASLLVPAEGRASGGAVSYVRAAAWVAVLGAALSAVAFLVVRTGTRAQVSTPTSHAPAAASEVPRAAPPPAPSSVTVHFETTPAGALVLINGSGRGATPLDVALPRSTDACDVEVRREGYATAVQRLTPDVDQRVLLSLQQQAAPRADRAPVPTRRPAPSAISSGSPSPPTEYPKF